MSSSHPSANAEVIAKIEAVFENIADSLSNEENPCVPSKDIFIPIRYKNRAPSDQNTPSLSNAEPADDFKNVSFPARGRPKEAWRFTVLIRILDLMHEALCDNVIISKRNIYYKDPALFKTQLTVDRYVDIIAYTFGVSRFALNVTAAAKGLVAGNFIMTRTDGTQASRKPDVPHIIDDPHNIQAIDVSDVAWILVVEKESTFRTLASGNLHRSSRVGYGLILTAKGYPDISTRSFLRLLSTSHDPDSIPSPVYALTDFDPDGLAIMSTYKHGSFKLSHENAGLNVPRIQWLGIQSRDVLVGNEHDEPGGLLRLSARDRKKAADMLGRSEVLQEGGMENVWRRELQVMLMLNVKAEMEILADRQGGVKGWVEEKLLEDGNGLHADEDLLDMHQRPDGTLDGMDMPSHQADEDLLLDVHEPPDMQSDPPSSQANRYSLEPRHLADMTLDEDESPGLQADEDFMLDTDEMNDTPVVGGSQTDEDLLDTYEMADESPADAGSPGFEWDEEL